MRNLTLDLSRRRFLSGATACGLLAAWERPAQAATRVLILGDSMIAGAFGLYLEKELEGSAGLEARRRGKSSSGLARPDFFNWMKEGKKAFAAAQPQATVVMFGGNDGQGLYMGRGADPKWIRYHEPGWTPEYTRRVSAFADLIAPAGQKIFWVGMPVMRPTKLNARVEHMNGIFRREMERRPHGHFVDIWKLLAGPEGEYQDRLQLEGKRVRVRASDGVHLTGSGARHLVNHVAPIVRSHLGL